MTSPNKCPQAPIHQPTSENKHKAAAPFAKYCPAWKPLPSPQLTRTDPPSPPSQSPQPPPPVSELTSGNIDEVLSGGLVDLNVAIRDVMFVPLERHVAVLLTDEPHQRFPVPPALLAETQRHAAPAAVRGRVRVAAKVRLRRAGRAGQHGCGARGLRAAAAANAAQLVVGAAWVTRRRRRRRRRRRGTGADWGTATGRERRGVGSDRRGPEWPCRPGCYLIS